MPPTVHCSAARHQPPDPGRELPFRDPGPIEALSSIYTVTAIAINEVASANEPPLITALETSRVFGWFPSIGIAQEAVLRDDGGMHESLYTHLVIEEVPAGILTSAKVVGWYLWAGKRGWIACKPPRWAKGVVNWSIG